MITEQGAKVVLQYFLQGLATPVPAGGDFFVGLTSGTYDRLSTLADAVLNEPSGAGGYARLSVTRDATATGWTDPAAIGAALRSLSAVLTWTPAGADYDKAITRLFLTDVLSGDVGSLISVGQARENPLTLLDGVGYPFQYEMYLR